MWIVNPVSPSMEWGPLLYQGENKMPKFEEHKEISKKMFRIDGSEYHKWIDHYSKFGYRHRQVLHNKEGVEVGVQLFGEKARVHLEQHIKDDYKKDIIPSIKDLKGYPRATDGLKEHKNKYEIEQINAKEVK